MPVASIDQELCIGCGTCIESCPMDVFRLDTSSRRIEVSPCSNDCSLGLDQREYHNLMKQGRMNEAATILQQRHPMPSITGRVCPHPCESNCTRQQVDSPININGLEQYLGDYMLNNITAGGNGSGDKVAVIGSGPAGLSAAFNLAQNGYQVTVFEKDPKPGGLLQYSIPAFRLPNETIEAQINYYKAMGIEFRLGTQVGKDVSKNQLEAEGFKAFIATVGAAKPMTLDVPGCHAANITSAIQFLKDARTDVSQNIPTKVAVIGGGSVSLDAARTALRIGAKEVHVVCLERIQPGHKDTMLALTEEIEECHEEGIIFHTQRSVKAFKLNKDQVHAISLVECSSVRNEDRSFNPCIGSDVVEELVVDGIIMAIGQTADGELVPTDFNTTQRGFINADSKTLQVSNNLFAAGDGVTGPTTVVRALASGKRVAAVVDQYLKGEELAVGLDIERPMSKDVPENHNLYTDVRQERNKTCAQERINNFKETSQNLTRAQVQRESERCLTCGSRSTIAAVDDCQVCRLCAHYCPADCIEITDGAYMTSLHNFDVVQLGTALADK
ncbi:FAD-dependent oxidoreductase [Vibrio sp. WJH972]